ncbi:MAG TPA: alpha/beta hydrolase [Rhodoferax sp.]|jgi:pimeloyl-ACP methyl ester carboxylesterase|nr:alpha/beta hydrolase [Rhodoferax sp.]HOF52636.1 alpha/beta hydrolase [Rhodoferax sp.]HQY77226.1 alpha/beta hydrolase [Rhodoferax sp.]
MTPAVEFATITWRNQPVRLEYQWVGVRDAQAPVMVFLHEGLGSVSMWRNFPDQLCQALGCRGLVYSRPGYGNSTPRAADDHWAPDFMHRQADEVLPAFLRAVGVHVQKQPLWLFGHSDGGSIALLYATHHPKALAGAIVVAPHILVEEVSIASIAQARNAYLETDLRQRLARHHADPDSAFWGWNDIWLDPGFRPWRIDEQLGSITCPLLAVQGVDDAYGTLEQIRGIARKVPQCELLELQACGHSPHKDQPDRLIAAVTHFFQRAVTAAGAVSPP